MKRLELDGGPKPMRLMLDSGAFSAWNSGERITCAEYGNWLRHNKEPFELIASLDVIPAWRGRKAMPDDVEKAATKSWVNYQRLLDRGHDVIPVFHYGESPRFLRQMFEHECKYIGLGALVGVSRRDRRRWLNFVFKEAPAGTHFHGFGMTDFELMLLYPWKSVDSSSWLIDSSVGLVYFPTTHGSLFRIYFSDRPTKQRKKFAFHDMGPTGQEAITTWLKSIGLSVKDVITEYEARRFANVQCVRKLMNGTGKRVYFGMSTITNEKALNRAGERNRLLAYHLLRKQPNFDPAIYRVMWSIQEARS